MRALLIFFFYLSFNLPFIKGQVNFRHDFEKSNPIPSDSNLLTEEQLKIHEDFLKDAVKEGNLQKELYANLHIFMSLIKMEKYSDAARYIFEAENIAKKSGNLGWEGWVNYRSGILYIRIDQEEKAIENYQKSVDLCSQVGDSLCIGESLEQLGALRGLLGDHEEAEEYYNQAIPILKKYGGKKNMATVLNNYGGLLLMKGDHLKSIPVLEEGIETNLEIEKFESAAKGMNNIASSYRRLKQFDKAIEYYEKAIKINETYGFAQNMIRNYMGLHIVYLDKKEYEKSMDFLIKRYQLKDSLVGQQTQLKIANLEKSYEAKSQELELEKTHSSLLATKRSLERTFWVVAFLLLLIGFGIWYFRTKSLKIKHQKEEAEKDLNKLTKILIDKNSTIFNLNTQLSKVLKNQKTESLSSEKSELFINTSILTSEDWISYKTNFEKLHPGYLYRLRLAYPTLSDAEERLFLLIKVQLKTREIAGILGVSLDTVKKTRQRLRKRLDLNKSLPLDRFIKDY